MEEHEREANNDSPTANPEGLGIEEFIEEVKRLVHNFDNLSDHTRLSTSNRDFIRALLVALETLGTLVQRDLERFRHELLKRSPQGKCPCFGTYQKSSCGLCGTSAVHPPAAT